VTDRDADGNETSLGGRAADRDAAAN